MQSPHLEGLVLSSTFSGVLGTLVSGEVCFNPLFDRDVRRQFESWKHWLGLDITFLASCIPLSLHSQTFANMRNLLTSFAPVVLPVVWVCCHFAYVVLSFYLYYSCTVRSHIVPCMVVPAAAGFVIVMSINALMYCSFVMLFVSHVLRNYVCVMMPHVGFLVKIGWRLIAF